MSYTMYSLGFSVQLRGEFFNVLNHPTFTSPNGVGGQLGNVEPSIPVASAEMA